MNEIIFYKKPEYIKDLSKKFRYNQTKTEGILWEKLKWKQINWLRFHRQKSLFAFKENNWFDRFYIADFYCNPKKIIIELDWNVHNTENQKEYDKVRNEILKSRYTIIRLKNDDILDKLDEILEEIKKLTL